jgi:hypothetical protein
MKRLLLPLITTLSFAMLAFAADAPKGTLHFSGAEVQQVLPIYKALSGLELLVDSRVNTVYSTINLRSSEVLTNEEALKRIEKALLEQARVVITRLDALPIVLPSKSSAR